jgi:hypothetical protein
LNAPVNRVDLNGRSAWSIAGALVCADAVYSASIYTIATGLANENDYLVDLGFQMTRFIAPAAYFGAAVGPVVPAIPGALTSAAVATWEGIAGAAAYTSGIVGAGAEALSYWAMANPYEFISIVDVLGQIGGPPDGIPITPAGFLTWFYVNTHN